MKKVIDVENIDNDDFEKLFKTHQIAYADKHIYKTDKKERQAIRDKYADAYPMWLYYEDLKELELKEKSAKNYQELTKNEDKDLPIGFKE